MKTRTGLVVALALAASAASVRADGPAGPVYKDPNFGIAVEGGAGWGMTPTNNATAAWTLLCTFNEPISGAVSLVSARKARVGNVAGMRAEITTLYGADKSFSISSIANLAPTSARAMPGLLVDATQTKNEPAPVGSAPGTPPTPIVFRTIAAYFIGSSGTEYLLFNQVRATIYSRVQSAIDKMVASFSIPDKAATESGLPKGGGTYRDDKIGFACRCPAGYGVRIPESPQQAVEFAPTADGPIVGVYSYASQLDLEKEAKTLVDYYKGEEVGGEAETSNVEISGHSAVVVSAHGRMGGKDQVFFVAVLKRENTTFRLRVAADKGLEMKAKEVFDAFTATFAMTNG